MNLSKRQDVRNIVGIAALMALGLGCDLVTQTPRGPVATSLIEQIYVIDAEATTCLSCPDGVIPDEVRDVLGAVDSAEAGGWIQSRFTMRWDSADIRMKDADPARIWSQFDMGELHGVVFQGDGYRIHYEEIPCRVWDCYKPRMWRIDDGDRQRWRRRVPFAHAPVVPFVVGRYILYVGGSVDGDILVFLDVNTGRVIGHFLPENEEHGRSDSGLLFDPPFYCDGHIYLRGYSNGLLDPQTRKVVEEIPAKRYVLKVNF